YKSELLRYCLNRGKAFFLVPSTYEIFLSNADVKQMDDLPVLEVIKLFPSNGVVAVKRVIDIVLSALGLIILSPLMIIVALAIKATSPDPVFYLQERVGQGEKPFMLYKFRTMINNAEARTGPVLASDDDPRITPIGKFLRATRIDEIPQLWNVLKGDMSLVGPRPERPFFIEKFKKEIPGYEYRHLVKPGITGLAQIAGKYSTTADDKLRYDLMYIGNLSLLQDIKILVQTVPVVMNSSAAGGVEKRKHNYNGQN
ncbi:MAG: sugar transferase, partial [Thermacetogeniaceae bacterium]